MTIPLDQQLEHLIRTLVDNPENVVLNAQITSNVASFEVSVDPGDVGKLLGRKGVYADAIRRLWSAAYGKQNMGFHLHIVDPRRQQTRGS